jgi:indoleamine 2,3-dioxygenase
MRRGFLPETDPLVRLPAPFDAWEALAAELPKRLVAQKVRDAARSLPPFPIEALREDREWARAMVVISHIAVAYVWGDPQPAAILPARLAQPWHAVATRLGLPPMMVYAYHALHKWRRIDPAGPIAVGNIVLTQNFTGGIDEEWFSLIHVHIEADAVPGISALPGMQQAVANDDASALHAAFETLAASLDAMLSTLDRMYERCDPYVYYHRVRPFMFGWRNNPALPEGMIYEGVAEYGGRPMQFYGETGAQSAIIPSIDAALGIAHEMDDMRVYLMAMRDYVPPGARAFVASLEAGPSVRAYVVQRNHAGLREAYNACVMRVDTFRRAHLKLASDYIYKQNEAAGLGTGGTSFMPYLSKHTRETRASLL